MKTKKVTTTLMFILAISSLKASVVEEWAVLDLFGLVYRCPVIFTAKPLESEGFSRSTVRRFVIENRIRTNGLVLPDTINIAEWQFYEICNCRSWADLQAENMPTLNSYDLFVFFGEFHIANNLYIKRAFYPIMSGIRAFRSDTMFAAYRIDSVSDFMLRGGEVISSNDFVKKIYRTMTRIDSLVELRKITPVSEQNKALIAWAKVHLEDLKNSNSHFIDMLHHDKEDNWGQVQWEIFQWINGNGIWQDAWEGMVLSMEINDIPVRSCPDYRCNTRAFANLEARTFLYEIIGDTLTKENVLSLAIEVLNDNLFYPDYQEKTPRIEQPERQRILNLMTPLLAHQSYNIRSGALSIISQVIDNSNAGIPYAPYHYDEAVLIALKSALLRETEGYLKENLIRVIAQMEQSKK